MCLLGLQIGLNQKLLPPLTNWEVFKKKSKKAPQKQKVITNQDIHGPIVGLVEVEVELVPSPIQLQVQARTPKNKMVTHSSTKKASTTKGKSTVTVDLEIAEEPPMVDSVPEP